MEQKKKSLKNISQTKKGKRQYANSNATLFSHPTRQKILGNLQSGQKTTSELESLIGENRVNLYHHLNLLENDGIINAEIENRNKIFSLSKNLKEEKSPVVLISVPDNDKIQSLVINKIRSIQNTINENESNIKLLSSNEIKGRRVVIDFE